MSNHDGESSKPKAPTPRVTRLHSAFSMSSPEIDEHISPETPFSGQKASSSQKRRPSFVDNSFCGVKGCVVCRDEETPKPTLGRGFLFGTSSPPDSRSLREAGSSKRNLFKLRKKLSKPLRRSRLISPGSTRSTSSKGSSWSMQTRSSVPSHPATPLLALFEGRGSPFPNASPVQRNGHVGTQWPTLSSFPKYSPTSSQALRPRPSYELGPRYLASTSPPRGSDGSARALLTNVAESPTLLRNENRRNTSPHPSASLSGESLINKTSPISSSGFETPTRSNIDPETVRRALRSTSSIQEKRSISPSHSSPTGKGFSTVTEVPPRPSSPSISPKTCQRSPPASSPVASASASHANLSSSSAESQDGSLYSALEKHAHCAESDCALRKRYIEYTSSLYTLGFLPTPQILRGISQAAFLGRHEECTCPIFCTAPGEHPLRPQHESISQDNANPRIQMNDDGDMILVDREKQAWYLMALKKGGNLMSELMVVASGEYKPLLVPELTPLGYNCPCYDEVHGIGASAKIKEGLIAQGKLRPSASDHFQHTGSMTSNSSDEQGSINLNGCRYRQAINALEKRYLATFPWLERRALQAKVKQNCDFLRAEHKNILSAKLENHDILNFYGAWNFVDGTELDDKHDVTCQEPSLIDYGGYHQAEWKGNSANTKSVNALKGKYLAAYPWLGAKIAESKARFDVTWLESQAIYHYRGKNRSIEDRIIKLYGAQQWDT